MNVNGIPWNWYLHTICTSIFKFFCKYWPDDGPLRPKLVANINITINIILLCQTEYLYSLSYQSHNYHGTWVLLQYTANIFGYTSSNNKAKGEKCVIWTECAKAHMTRQTLLFFGECELTIWQLRWPLHWLDLTAPDVPPWECLKCNVNAACTGYNQKLKVSTTGGTVTNNGALLQQITQNFKTLQYRTTYGGKPE